MKPFSVRRRQVLIAGIAGAAIPAVISAAHAAAPGLATASAMSDATLVVSGRVVTPDGRPLSGAAVEVWHAGAGSSGTCAPCATVSTDGDGRFVFSATTPTNHAGEPRQLRYRVSHRDHAATARELHFSRASGVPGQQIARLQRDEAGTWRTTFALTVA